MSNRYNNSRLHKDHIEINNGGRRDNITVTHRTTTGFECNDCGMDFDTSVELQNHMRKFCANSHYDNQDALEKRMNELRNSSNDLGFDYKPKAATVRRGPATVQYSPSPYMN